MQRILTTREATVQTVQVEIKALKVGKKQVTMGLFRQLPHARLIDPKTVQLRGVPWGHVNYWWENDGSHVGDGRKLHVVWQLGDELRRAVVFQGPDPAEIREFDNHIQDLVGDWVLASLASAKTFTLTRTERFTNVRTAEIDNRGYTVKFDDAEVRKLEAYWVNREIDVESEAQQNVAYMTRTYSAEKAAETYASDYARAAERKAQAIQGYHGLLELRGLSGLLPATIAQQIREVQAEREAFKDAWAKQWQVLSALPQLFIAV